MMKTDLFTEGDHIKVTASKYPFPTVCADKASTDWFSSISRTLRWNEREKQKSFVVVEEDHEGPSDGVKGGPRKQARDKKHAEAGNSSDPRASQSALRRHDEEDENGDDDEEDDDEENEEEEEEEFDIDE
jgi:NAD+ kinase